MTLKELEQKALELPVKERARLAKHLLLSLDERDDPVKVQQACMEEVRKRRKAYQEGRITASPADEVFQRIRKRVR